MENAAIDRKTSSESARFGRALTVSRRYEGFSGIANGGVVVGLLARALRAPVEVTLRRPTAVESQITLRRPDAETAELVDRQGTLASAARVQPFIEIPPPVTFDEAVDARERYTGFTEKMAVSCFSCGAGRAPGDGLRLFPGEIDKGRVAAPWVPALALARAGFAVEPEVVGAALDCPGAWAIFTLAKTPLKPMLLGKMAFRSVAPIRAALPHVVVGVANGAEGRKHFATTAVFGPDGELCAVARSIWIEPR